MTEREKGNMVVRETDGYVRETKRVAQGAKGAFQGDVSAVKHF